LKNIWLTGIMGVVLGDALGMPVQFCDREKIKAHPVRGMEGYGTYNMPIGTWSDDSSMTLATLDSIREKKGIELDDIMNRFVEWLYQGQYTPFEEALLKAVNLGGDSDTIGAIAGGLAALYYGYENIPHKWLEVIVGRENIEAMCDMMEDFYVR